MGEHKFGESELRKNAESLALAGEWVFSVIEAYHDLKGGNTKPAIAHEAEKEEDEPEEEHKHEESKGADASELEAERERLQEELKDQMNMSSSGSM